MTTSLARFPSVPLLAYLLLQATSLSSGCNGEEEPIQLTPFSANGSSLMGVAYADGRFVAVGGTAISSNPGTYNARIGTSKDSENWVFTDFPGVPLLFSVAHGPGRWVAVGGQLNLNSGRVLDAIQGAVMVSDDGVAWRAARTVLPPYAQAVAYGNGLFVAMGADDSSPYVSTDGELWERIAFPKFWWSPGVSYVGDRFIAYGEGPAIAESKDGRSWLPSDTTLTVINSVTARVGAALGVGYYDCCYGEVPEGIQSIALERTGEGVWSFAMGLHQPLLFDIVAAGIAVVGVDSTGLWRATGATAAWQWQKAYAQDRLRRLTSDGAGTLVGVGEAPRGGIPVSHDDGLTWHAAAN